MRKIHYPLAILAALTLLKVSPVWAQCPGASENGKIAASPSRPTITDSPETIAPGVVEVESGWTSGWPGAGVRQDSFGALYKMGLFCNFEFRIFTGLYQAQASPHGTNVKGWGDNWITAQYRFHRETRRSPSLAAMYWVKAPTASWLKGLGSGCTDHIVSLSALKAIPVAAISFESKWIFSGRPGTSGFDQNAELSLNISRGIKGPLGFIGEVYGDTQRNSSTPAFASTLWALTYNVSPRLLFDAGVDTGLTSGAPKLRAFAGVSYAVGDLYRRLRPHSRPAD